MWDTGCVPRSQANRGGLPVHANANRSQHANEGANMNEKETKQQLNKPAEAIEDLTVKEADAEEVKGGPTDVFLRLDGVDGPSTDVRPNPGVRTAYNPYVTVDYAERTPK